MTFTYQRPTQARILPECKSDSALEFMATIVVDVVDADSEIHEIMYNFKITTVNGEVGAETRAH